MTEHGLKPTDKDYCDLKFWEGLAYITPFKLKPSVFNFDLKYYDLN